MNATQYVIMDAIEAAWPAAPPCCRRCAFRSPDVACLVPEIQRRAMLARDAILGEPTC